MTDGRSHRHHCVAQGYLRGFLGQSDDLFVLNKERGSIRPTSTKGVAYAPDFYLVDTLQEKDSNEIEETLGIIESTGIPLLGKISQTANLPNSELADIAIYIAIQYGRTPRARSNMNEVATIVGNNMFKQLIADALNDPVKYQELLDRHIESGTNPELLERENLIRLVTTPGPVARIEADRGAHVKQFFEMASEIAEGLLGAKWEVYHAPGDSQFLTSDNPIGLEASRPLKEHETLAILLPGVIRYFPLDGGACLVAGGRREDGEIEHRQVSSAEVMRINDIIRDQAYKYVISGYRNLLESP